LFSLPSLQRIRNISTAGQSVDALAAGENYFFYKTAASPGHHEIHALPIPAAR